MINNIQKLFKITATLVIGSLILWNCEPDPDQLGSQFFQNGAQGTETLYPVIAYNAKNGDTIRTDAVRLNSATLGAFSESQFGLQKSAFVTQVRLSSYAPNFGVNPIIDSAVLVIKPLYAADSITTTTDETYIYPIGAVEAKKVVNNYPVTKYGKAKLGGTKTTFNIKVREVTDFLGGNTDQIRSNKIVGTGSVIGSKVFKGDVNSIVITKKTDNSVLFQRDATIRIPMDSAFFQNKIITKGTAPELTDAASFIRYFKGLKISVDENDGYIFNFDPNSMVINLYYKKDKVDGTTTTREQMVYPMDVGSSNTHFSQIDFVRAGTPSETALASSNEVTGDSRIYAQGMGGPGIGLRVPLATVDAIKAMYKNDKIGIISAKIRIYTDAVNWNNSYRKPITFVVRQRDLSLTGEAQYLKDFLTDISALAYTGNYNLVKAYDLDKNPAYYDIGITQTFKNIIETESKNNDLILNVGNYTTDANGNLLGIQYKSLGQQNFNSRSFTPFRAVFIGTEANNVQSPKLILTYGKK
ncbi:DUF4270 family protein [Kaistella jeonii]|uniref:DUF4270 domain-containing protein n=1 Tax=Kaistella jeonii TaxID=266749 RepID=A0A0C1CX40_9FLAO|nr:DUF4270 family protein [Kaistella jeonii]KIA88956.1 hypothetical protein OA86_07675 [Kaistella jeonii]SFB98181.1 protein of unknown function [Kaistella jeonii]VEI97255.1 Uncharacterised protein [Kaistella jeonii]